MTAQNCNLPELRKTWRGIIACLAGLVAAFLVQTASAQAQDKVAAGLLSWRMAGCAACHGNFGEGGGGGEQPEGPSLRKTALDAAALRETIRCGRPGSKMPLFLAGAYTETSCWGLPKQAEVPNEVSGSGSLTADSIDAMVEYLMARVVGKSETITKAECVAYFGNPNHPACAAYQ
jgi:mono/diheme cytochrome c family protein